MGSPSPECAFFAQREMVSLQNISHYQRVQSYYLSVLLTGPEISARRYQLLARRLNDAALAVLFSSSVLFSDSVIGTQNQTNR
jgi:hypothetical protein